jgi:hypothetical protein
MLIPCILNNKCFYIPTYAQIGSANLYLITPTCFGVNASFSGSLQDVLAKHMNDKIQYSNGVIDFLFFN